MRHDTTGDLHPIEPLNSFKIKKYPINEYFKLAKSKFESHFLILFFVNEAQVL